MDEQWLPIRGYEGLYEISSLGRVRSLDRMVKGKIGNCPRNGQILNSRLATNGYLRVNLGQDGQLTTKSVHRLVAEHFLSRCDEKLQVNHLDRSKQNNVVTNLEWCTCMNNLRHASKNLSPEIALAIRQARKSGMKYRAIAERFGIHIRTVFKIIRGEAWS